MTQQKLARSDENFLGKSHRERRRRKKNLKGLQTEGEEHNNNF